MTCEQCTSLQAQGGDSLPTESLDIPLWLQSNGNLTLAKSLENEPPRDGFPDCECGKGTCKCLIHPNTPDEWIASMRDSLVKILVSLENKPELAKGQDQGFTEKSCVLLAQLDRDSSSWKMSPRLNPKVLTKLSKTWPSWGMTRDGCVYEHPMSGHRITEIDGSHCVIPTPTSSIGGPNHNSPTVVSGKRFTMNLAGYAKMWPTPTAHMAKETNAPSEALRNEPSLSSQVGGSLNPSWAEWLMGWPIDHTVSKQLATGKYHSKSQSHLPSWLKA